MMHLIKAHWSKTNYWQFTFQDSLMQFIPQFYQAVQFVAQCNFSSFVYVVDPWASWLFDFPGFCLTKYANVRLQFRSGSRRVRRFRSLGVGPFSREIHERMRSQSWQIATVVDQEGLCCSTLFTQSWQSAVSMGGDTWGEVHKTKSMHSLHSAWVPGGSFFLTACNYLLYLVRKRNIKFSFELQYSGLKWILSYLCSKAPSFGQPDLFLTSLTKHLLLCYHLLQSGHQQITLFVLVASFTPFYYH